MTNAIEVINVSKKYQEFTLDNVSFQLPCGCIMGLIGENGAGKSTTIKLILDLIRKDSGEIFVMGNEPVKSSKRGKEDIGVVMDECCFLENLTLKDINKIMSYTYLNWSEETFLKFAGQFSLSEKKQVKDYSRGMKMKLSIAAALSHTPKLLILDEATSGLDPIVRDEILDVFLEFIQNDDHSILISSHIISDLEKICDYITFIHRGKLVFSESKDKLLEKYGLLKCSVEQFDALDKAAVKGFRKNSFGVEALVLKDKIRGDALIDRATMEEIMLYHIKEGVR